MPRLNKVNIRLMKLGLRHFVVAVLLIAISVGLLEKLSDMGEQITSAQTAMHVFDADTTEDDASDFFDHAVLIRLVLPLLVFTILMLPQLAPLYSPPLIIKTLRPPLY